MTVWGYYISAMRHYADFDGRASRSELFAYLAGMAVILFAAALVGPALLNVTPVILVLAILGHLVPTLDAYDRILSVCTVNGVELNAAMVSSGLAWAFRRYADDYSKQEDQARTAGLGIWQATTETPWEFRDRRWSVAVQVAPEGCPIKGNISDSGRIYHTPWSPWYSKTKVSLEKGEQWFCSERDALDAGWRAPIWGH